MCSKLSHEMLAHLFFFFLKILFIYSWHTHTHTHRGRDTGRGKSRLHASQGARRGTLPRDSKIMPRAEGGAKLLSLRGCPPLAFITLYGKIKSSPVSAAIQTFLPFFVWSQPNFPFQTWINHHKAACWFISKRSTKQAQVVSGDLSFQFIFFLFFFFFRFFFY